MRKIICFVLAALFFALGIVGIIFPVIPQVPFLIMGILFLAAASTRFKHFLTETEFYKKYLKEHVDKNETLSKFMNE